MSRLFRQSREKRPFHRLFLRIRPRDGRGSRLRRLAETRSLATLAKADGDEWGAVLDLIRSLEIDPNSPGGLRNRSYARAKLGDKKGAIEDLERYLSLEPRPDDWDQEKDALDRLKQGG